MIADLLALLRLKQVMHDRLVTRLTIEERMMQQSKKKMVLEHLVVHKMNSAADLKQVNLPLSLPAQ